MCRRLQPSHTHPLPPFIPHRPFSALLVWAEQTLDTKATGKGAQDVVVVFFTLLCTRKRLVRRSFGENLYPVSRMHMVRRCVSKTIRLLSFRTQRLTRRIFAYCSRYSRRLALDCEISFVRHFFGSDR